MVRLKRRRHYKTTDSSHHYHKYPNLILDVVPSRPNEIWVSDIKIVGWSVGPTLETRYPLGGLRMALETIDNGTATLFTTLTGGVRGHI
jgi:hypothetical protein